MQRHIMTVLAATCITLLTTLATAADHREAPALAVCHRQVVDLGRTPVLFQASVAVLPRGTARGFIGVALRDGTIHLLIPSAGSSDCEVRELLILVTPVIIHPDGEIRVGDDLMVRVSENDDTPECLIWEIQDSDSSAASAVLEAQGRIRCGRRGR